MASIVEGQRWRGGQIEGDGDVEEVADEVLSRKVATVGRGVIEGIRQYAMTTFALPHRSPSLGKRQTGSEHNVA
uniref:Uncharacterized protein n=1 Tax=Oryza meridionalis TaxID=40149 RepID=A0A0E0C3T2_9ORYZ